MVRARATAGYRAPTKTRNRRTAIAAVVVIKNVQPFLAPTRREPAKILVVEGWIAEYANRAAAQEFQTGGYEKVFVTGGPIVGTGVRPTSILTTSGEDPTVCLVVVRPDELPAFAQTVRGLVGTKVVARVEAEPHL